MLITCNGSHRYASPTTTAAKEGEGGAGFGLGTIVGSAMFNILVIVGAWGLLWGKGRSQWAGKLGERV